MIDHNATLLALRNRLLALSVATTGTTSLAATATGFTRAAGSFVTDGFAVGMEVLASGFATAGNNGYKVITAVTATTLTVSSLTTMSTEAAGANELIVAGLPEGRAWENAQFTPTTGRPYIEEDFVPATTEHFAGPYNGGRTREEGLYVIKWFGLTDKGAAGIRRCASAVLDLFAPGTTLTVGTDQVRCRGNPGPWAGQLLPLESGWTVCTITVPWTATTQSVVAA